jgi:hypothetical protein
MNCLSRRFLIMVLILMCTACEKSSTTSQSSCRLFRVQSHFRNKITVKEWVGMGWVSPLDGKFHGGTKESSFPRAVTLPTSIKVIWKEDDQDEWVSQEIDLTSVAITKKNPVLFLELSEGGEWSASSSEE